MLAFKFSLWGRLILWSLDYSTVWSGRWVPQFRGDTPSLTDQNCWVHHCDLFKGRILRHKIFLAIAQQFARKPFLGAFAKLRKSYCWLRHVCLSVRTDELGSHWFMKFDIWVFFWKYVEKIHVPFKSDNNNGHLHADQYTFTIISRSVLLRMRNDSDKSCGGN